MQDDLEQQEAANRELQVAFQFLLGGLIAAELEAWPSPRMVGTLDTLELHETELRQSIRELAFLLMPRGPRGISLLEDGRRAGGWAKLTQAEQARRLEAIRALLPVLDDELRDWPTPRVLGIVGELDDEHGALLRQTLRDFISAARPA